MSKRSPATAEAIKAVFEARVTGGIKTADDVRAVANAMWAVCHDEGMDKKEMLNTLSLLSGMAVAALLDYAVMLDDERIEIVESQAS